MTNDCRAQRATAVRGFLAGLAVLVCAACSGGTPAATAASPSFPASASSAPASTPPPSPASSPPAIPAPPEDIDGSEGLGYAGVCGATGDPTAARYKGPGPHPVDFEGGIDFYEGNIDIRDNGGSLLSSSSRHAEPAGWAPARAAKVQLVACVQPAFTTTTRVGSCRYTALGAAKATKYPLYAGQYTITLFVARTGEKLAGPATVTGRDRTCPASILTFGGNKHQPVYTSLSVRQLKAVIGKYAR